MDWNLIVTALGAILYKSPLYITWMIGVVFIIVYSKKHGNNAMLLSFIIAGLFIIDVIIMMFNSGGIMYMRGADMDVEGMSSIILSVNLVLIILESMLWGLLFYLFITKTRPKLVNEI